MGQHTRSLSKNLPHSSTVQTIQKNTYIANTVKSAQTGTCDKQQPVLSTLFHFFTTITELSNTNIISLNRANHTNMQSQT